MDSVFYYCGARTFENILLRKRLWLNEITKSNDSEELRFFPKLLKNHFCDLCAKVQNENFDREKSVLWFDRAVDSQIEKKKCYAMCFSELRDDISQWRGYGDDGRGYAIGFDQELLLQLARETSLRFESVKYQDGWSTKAKDKELDRAFLAKIENCLEKPNSWKKLQEFYRYSIERWLEDAPVYKNPAFRAEQEKRLFFYQNGGEAVLREDYRLHFGETGFSFHLDIDFQKFPQMIREIIVGPKNNGDVKELREYCEKLFDRPMTVSLSALNYTRRI